MRDPSLDNVYPTVAFHWDKDEDLVDDAGINVFPQLSTVREGSFAIPATLVLNRRRPIFLANWTPTSLSHAAGYIPFE